jgi:hypothetical protein
MPARRTSLIVESLQNLILLFGRGSREFFDTGKEFADAGLQGGKTVTVSFLVVDGESSKTAVDEVDDAGFAGTGGLAGGDDARGYGVDFDGFLGSEELEFGRRGRLGSLVRVLGGSDDSGPIRGDPDGTEGGAATREKIPTAKIFDHRWRRNEQLEI